MAERAQRDCIACPFSCRDSIACLACPGQQAAPRQGNSWLTQQLELLNRIQPRVAEAVEREKRARQRQAGQEAE